MSSDPTTGRTEFVYLIGSEGSPIVKIGRSVDVPGRLAAIQFMSPLKLSVLWQTKGGAELEAALHRRFKAFRSHGEWFEFPDGDAPTQVAQAIVEIAAEEKRRRTERREARKARKLRKVWNAPKVRRVRVKRVPPAAKPVSHPLVSKPGPRRSIVKKASHYQQVAEILRSEIHAGTFPSGSLLPSEPELAKWLGVARPTVNRALSSLRQEGLVRPRRGVGTLVTNEPPLRRVRNLATDPRRFRELVRSRVPEPDEARALGVDDDQWIIAITRTTLEPEGRAIEVTELTPANRIELHREWTFDQWIPETA